MAEIDYLFAPLDRWLPLLAAGWRFAGLVVEPMAGHHGRHAVLLERRVS